MVAGADPLLSTARSRQQVVSGTSIVSANNAGIVVVVDGETVESFPLELLVKPLWQSRRRVCLVQPVGKYVWLFEEVSARS